MTAYSEDALVLVRFPLPGQDSDRETWPWLPGIITAVCPMGPGRAVPEVGKSTEDVIVVGMPTEPREFSFHHQGQRLQSVHQGTVADSPTTKPCPP